MEQIQKTKSKRGFAAISPSYQKELARRGGRAAHARGTAHRWTAEEAKEAGRKGGRKKKTINAPAI